MKKPVEANAIAVVGLACWYPGARDARQLWENVLARRREVRRFPEKRLSIDDYIDPDPAVPDKFYQAKAGFIDGFVFDWSSYRIPQSTFAIGDIAQWLALDTARRALE